MWKIPVVHNFYSLAVDSNRQLDITALAPCFRVKFSSVLPHTRQPVQFTAALHGRFGDSGNNVISIKRFRPPDLTLA